MEMAVTQKLCVLTIHGIGFQQPPDGDKAGYADTLHDNLAAALNGRLGDDPQRPPAPHGPVYVKSAMPGTRNTEWGLSRLGSWQGGNLDVDGMPLAPDDKPVAHVALVYTSLEGVGPRVGPGAGTVAEAGLMLGQYSSVTGAIRLVTGDAWAALHEHAGVAAAASSPSLRPRTDLVHAHRSQIASMLHRHSAAPLPDSSGALGTIRALEDDVVGYVCRNDLRTRIGDFIAEALRRLLARPDVAGVVVNSHSQGTVASFDVLRRFPAGGPARVRALVTAGSPLRKYADLFTWGNDADAIGQLDSWVNVWDPKDPVADPLDQLATWRHGDELVPRPADTPGLIWTVAPDGQQVAVLIDDLEVDNLTHSSGGGLQAHNYWDNTSQFIPTLAGLLGGAG
jgi:hypothetical protein